ncbi:MAG TPA: pilus assembly protein PilM [Myxococcales bacterium]|nr:pilus assembly protein PilM [Myxococcales bacterium]HAN32192.1 pilus assembly protein PilM [Myxococcales bacterium]
MAGKNVIGLDIGTSSIKLAHLKQTKKGTHLLHFDSIMLPPDTIRDGQVMHAPNLSDRIQEIFKLNKVRHRKAAVSLSGHSVIIKKISLPEMTEDELEDSIQWEAEQYIPFDIKDVFVDAEIVNPNAGQGQMDVLLVAAKKAIIEELSEVVRDARVDPQIVDVDAFALYNAFELSYDVPLDDTIALINVGAATININVIAGGLSAFTRDITIGGNMLTEEISKQFAVPWEEAEHMKTSSETTLSMSGVLREVQRISHRISDNLVSEIQRSLDFFAATSMNARISTIYLCGGAALQTGLVSALETRIGAEVKALNPFNNLIIDPKKFDASSLQRFAPVAAVSIGLARRAKGER